MKDACLNKINLISTSIGEKDSGIQVNQKGWALFKRRMMAEINFVLI